MQRPNHLQINNRMVALALYASIENHTPRQGQGSIVALPYVLA